MVNYSIILDLGPKTPYHSKTSAIFEYAMDRRLQTWCASRGAQRRKWALKKYTQGLNHLFLCKPSGKYDTGHVLGKLVI